MVVDIISLVAIILLSALNAINLDIDFMSVGVKCQVVVVVLGSNSGRSTGIVCFTCHEPGHKCC